MPEILHLDDEVFEVLNHFEAREPGVDLDPNLICTIPIDTGGDLLVECGEAVCTIEYGDTLLVLAATALDHYKEHHA